MGSKDMHRNVFNTMFHFIYSQLGKAFSSYANKDTIRKFMLDRGYRTVGRYLRPFLSEEQISARLDWCLLHADDLFHLTIDVDEKVTT